MCAYACVHVLESVRTLVGSFVVKVVVNLLLHAQLGATKPVNNQACTVRGSGLGVHPLAQCGPQSCTRRLQGLFGRINLFGLLPGRLALEVKDKGRG